MFNTLKKSINSQILIICLFIFITGISAGIFFGAILPGTDKTHLLSVISSHAKSPTIAALLTNLILLSLICLAGFSVYGFPLSLILMMSRGFAFGFCDYLLLYSRHPGDLPGFLFSFLLPQLILSLIYMTASAAATGYAVSKLQDSIRI